MAGWLLVALEAGTLAATIVLCVLVGRLVRAPAARATLPPPDRTLRPPPLPPAPRFPAAVTLSASKRDLVAARDDLDRVIGPAGASPLPTLPKKQDIERS